MSGNMLTLMIFLGGVALVLAAFALDELTAHLGLQPKSGRWEITPLKWTETLGPGRFPERADRKTGAPEGARRSAPLPYSPTLSGLPAGSE